MMKAIRYLFLVYVPFLVLFFWRTAVFWLNERYGTPVGGDFLLYLGLAVVELVTGLLILFSAREVHRGSRRIHILCLSWEILMTIVLLYNRASLSNYIKCLAWPLFFESAYLFAKADQKYFTSLCRLFYVFVAIGVFYLFKSLMMVEFGEPSNLIFFLIMPLPVVLCTENPRIRMIIMALTSFLVLFSMKRSMMLAVLLFWAIIGIKYLVERKKKKLVLVLACLMTVGAIASFAIVDRVSDGHLSSRFKEEDITNGRRNIYRATWWLITKSRPVDLVLGHGHNAVIRDLDKRFGRRFSAHHDWLEIQYDYGILSLLLYVGLWIYVVKQWIYHWRHNTVFFLPYTLSVCVFAVMSVVDQLVVYVSYFLYLVMFWGMVGAATERLEESR